MKYGLKRIILVDSYLKGSVCQFVVDEHTNITGRNGVGKTTFLKLIPIFYGEGPGSVIRADKSTDNESFVGHYLPRNGSYIVYEYVSNGSLKCVVFCVTSPADARHRQIFIDSPYNEALFYDAIAKKSLPTSELLTRISTLNLKKKVAKSQKHYSEILMDCPTRDDEQFSIVPYKANQSKLIPLFTGMFKRMANFDDLKIILQGWCFDELDEKSKSNLKDIGLNKSIIDRWVNNYHAVDSLEKIKDKNISIKSDIDSIVDVKEQLEHILSTALDKKNTIEKELKLFESRKEEFVLEAKAATKENDEAIAELKRQRSNEEDDKEKLSAVIKSIESQHSVYMAEDIENAMEQCENIGYLQKDIEGVKVNLALAEQGSKDIESATNIEIAKINTEITEIKEDSFNRTNVARNEKETIVENLSDEFKKVCAHLDAKNEQNIDALNKELHQVISDISGLQTAVKYIQVDESLLVDERGLKENIDQHQERINQNINLRNTQQQLLNSISNKIDSLDREQLTINPRKSKLSQTISDTIRLRDGDKGTLLNFLRQEVPGWESSIGKVVDDGFLLKTDLNPTINDAESSFFGVDVNMDHLPLKRRSVEELEAKISLLKTDLEFLDTEDDRINLALKHERVLKKDSQDQLSSIDKQINQDSQSLETLNISSVKTRKKINDYVENKKNEISVELCVKTTLKESIETKVTRGKADARLERANNEKTFNKNKADAHLKFEKTSLLIENTKNEIIEKCGKRKVVALKNKDDKLKEKGVDTSRLYSLKEEITAKQKDLYILEGKKARVDTFKIFMNDTYSGLINLQSNKNEAEIKIKAFKAKIIERNNNEQINKDSFKIKTEDLEKRINVNKNDINLIDKNLNLMGVKAKQADIWHHLDVKGLIEQHCALSKKNIESTISLNKTVDLFVSVFNNHVKSKSHMFWEERNVGQDDMSKGKVIYEYFNDGAHDSARKSLQNDIQDFSKFDIYYQTLKTLNLRIKKYSGLLAAELEGALRYDNLTRLTPEITFNPDKLDHWKDIQRFSVEYNNFIDNRHEYELPNADFVHAIKELALRMIDGKTGVDSDIFIKLIDFKFQLVENGHLKHIRSANDMNDCSSNGLSYLVLITVFIAFIDMQRKKHGIDFIWALDELSNFDEKNIQALLETLSDKHITLVSACPDALFSQRFPRTYNIVNAAGKYSVHSVDRSKKGLTNV